MAPGSDQFLLQYSIPPRGPVSNDDIDPPRRVFHKFARTDGLRRLLQSRIDSFPIGLAAEPAKTFLHLVGNLFHSASGGYVADRDDPVAHRRALLGEFARRLLRQLSAAEQDRAVCVIDEVLRFGDVEELRAQPRVLFAQAAFEPCSIRSNASARWSRTTSLSAAAAIFGSNSLALSMT
jgi:hypothetical protein